MALSAWVCVLALTCSLTARWVTNALISGSAMSVGWRSPWKRTYLRTHRQYACSVRRL